MEAVLVVNAGSSSVKFQVFDAAKGGSQRLIRGQVDGVGTRPRLRAETAEKAPLIDQYFAATEVKDIGAALQAAGAWLRETQRLDLAAVGHRVVHGGPKYDRAVFVDERVLKDLERYIPLAPLHQPHNLAPIRSIASHFPEVRQVACFDTAFHRFHDALADHYAIPEQLYEEGVRRYGFHGLSYEYIAHRLHDVAPQVAGGCVIVAHLGSGASMCALFNGRSVESTMGFTALDGLPMGTRPGQLDPGIVLYLMEAKAMSAAEVQALLYHDCGLKGLSGLSNDVRDLEASADPRAQFALEYFAYRVGLSAGQMTAALGGVDAFVFTAGIGENSAAMRARIAQRLKWLGAEIDAVANGAGQTSIAGKGSRIALYIIPTDEELMIAHHTSSLLSHRSQ